jgi:outer membrane protein OmpU
MNKQLLSLTALVAAGLLGASGVAVAGKASKPKLTLGGYSDMGLAFVSNDGQVGGRDTGGIQSWYDTEIYFNLNSTLDNGLKIKGQWQLEGNALGAGETGSGADPGEVFDETKLTISGTFGSVTMGSHDIAPMMMVTGYQGSWNTPVAHNLPFDRSQIVPTPTTTYTNGGPNFSTREDLSDSDQPKITYMSPRMGGFQVGGSWTQQTGLTDPDNGKSTAPTDTENLWGVAANYNGKMGKSAIGIALGYMQDEPGTTDLAKNPGTRKAYVGGVKFDSGPIRVSAGFNINDDPNASGASTDGAGYDFGIKYSAGAHSFSASWFHGSIEGNTAVAGDDSSSTLWFGHNYSMGPGVRFKTTVGWVEWNGEGSAALESADGVGLMTSIQVNF